MSTVWLDLSSPEHHSTSALPNALRQIYYNGQKGDDLLSMISYDGFPHNGGMHTLKVSGERYDVIAWLDLFLEQYPDVKPEVDTIKKEIRKIFLRDPSRNVIRIKMAEFTRQHGYKGNLITRGWFWWEGCEPDYKDE